MKIAIVGVMLIALGALPGAGRAHLTPLQGTNRAVSDISKDMAQDFGPASVRFERDYFQAPLASQAVPEKAGRCTVSTFVFTKVRLAQACY